MYQKLQALAKTNEPNEFLEILRSENISNDNDYLLFNLTNKDDTFYQNLIFLADEDIWTKEELMSKILIAQTIDNDYILADSVSVLVIPYSLNKKDSETFPLSIWEFLIQFEEKKIDSAILSVK